MKDDVLLSRWYDSLQKRLVGNTDVGMPPNIRNDEDALAATSSLSYAAIRSYLLRSLRDLRLTVPFSWSTYLQVVQSAYARAHPSFQIDLKTTPLPQGTFARLIVVARLPACDTMVEHGTRRCRDMVATLLVAQTPDESRIERAVYHEMAHLELGHPLLPTHVPDWSLAEAPSSTEMARLREEHEAELFTTILLRLAHGWDPAALPAPRLEGFFDVLG